MKNITVEKNIKKYLKRMNIETNFKDVDLLNFAISVRQSELDKLIIELKSCTDEKRKLEIITLRKQKYNELFFYSEGLQEMEYDFDFSYFATEEKFTGTNYFEFFTYFIDVRENYCTLRTKHKEKNIQKKELIEIFETLDLFFYTIENNKVKTEKKKAIKQFLTETVFKKQYWEKKLENVNLFGIRKN